MGRIFSVILLLFVYLTLQAQRDPIFEEKEGLLIIEMESVSLPNGWQTDNIKFNPTGTGYIFWSGAEFFNNTGNGRITYNIYINNPGKYRFEWRAAVGLGTINTEHNDAWLKINSDDFWGERGTVTKVKPKPSCNFTLPEFKCPVGSSTNGFFKVYGGQWNQFQWKAATSDSDDHLIYAEFKKSGNYTIEINARSSFNMLDRMVLWDYNKYSIATTRSLNLPASSILVNSKEFSLSDLDIDLFPNPIQNLLTIEINNGQKIETSITNIYGKAIYEKEHKVTEKIDTHQWPQGSYFVKTASNGKSVVSKVVKI
jgi:hypothetical protein